MGLLDRFLGRRDPTRLQRRADEIGKRLSAIDTELAGVRERIEHAAKSRNDSDLTNMLIGELDTAMGRANTRDPTLVRERELKAERAALETELEQARKSLKQMDSPS